MNKRNELLARVYIVMMFFVFLSFWIIAKVFYVNIIEGEKWRSKIFSNVKWKVVEGDRGNIYSADGNILAASSPLFDVRMDLLSPTDKKFNENIDSLSFCISKYLRPDKSVWQWRQELKQSRKDGKNKKKKGMSFYLLKRNIKYEELVKVKDFPLFRLGQVKGGLIIEKKTIRVKPFKEMASRTIGIDRLNSSRIGLEGSYNEYLKGETTKTLMKKVGGGYWLPMTEIEDIDLAKGADIITNIDIRIQDIVHEEVSKQMLVSKAIAGVGIVMEVNTGKIVAMSNLSFEKDSTLKEMKNFAISEKYAPGSVIKGATALALLDDKLMKPDDLIDIEHGKKVIRGHLVRDDEDFGKGQPVTFRNAIVHSSNVAMAKLTDHFYNGSWSDRKRFVNKLKSFGFDKSTGIDLNGETNPAIKDPDNDRNDFYGTTVPWMSHGYEIEFTPLQILNFYNAIANGGKLMKPYLVDKIVKHDETIEVKPEVLKMKIAGDDAIRNVRNFLEGVVEEGTAVKLRDLGVKMAGKTGTAQIETIGNGEEMKYNSTFVGYFPSDKPKYSLIVVFYRNSKDFYYASQVAVPVVRNIVEKILSLQAIDIARKSVVTENNIVANDLPGYGTGYSNDFKIIFKQSRVPFKSEGNSRWSEVGESQRNMLVKSVKYSKYSVPDVKGMGARDAVYLLENLGLKVEVEGYGKVIAQTVMQKPMSDSKIIRLTLE
jgi:cell division protein FtsI (penicillin-binding protein 3)